MPPSMRLSVLVITNGEMLGMAVTRLIQRRLSDESRVFRLTYSDCVTQLTRELLHDTDWFILELLRQYPGGLRAEGLTLARRLIKSGKPALVISPLYLAQQLNCRMYWDASSADALSERVNRQVFESSPDPGELDRLISRFAPLMALPPQHQ